MSTSSSPQSKSTSAPRRAARSAPEESRGIQHSPGLYSLDMLSGEPLIRRDQFSSEWLMGQGSGVTAEKAIASVPGIMVRSFAIRGVNNLRIKLLNAGLTIRCKGDSRKWLKTWEPAIRRCIADYWFYRIWYDNAIPFWREPTKEDRRVIMLPLGQIGYHQVMGTERVEYTHNNPSNFEMPDRPGRSAADNAAIRERWKASKVIFGDATHQEWNDSHPNIAEFVRVWRAEPGPGLTIPQLANISTCLAQANSMEVGEEQYAFSGRTVIRQMKMGHAIVGGPRAGKDTYHWKKEFGDAWLKWLRLKTGLQDVTTNFDRTIVTNWIDPKNYRQETWGTIMARIGAWAGPLGIMLFARGQIPDLWNLLEVWGTGERDDAADFLEPIIAAAWDAPGDVSIQWSNKVWAPKRLQFEAMKAGVLQGNVSLTTMTESTVGDFDEEMNRKREEARLGDVIYPHYDPHHGQGGKPPLSDPGGRSKKGE